MSRYTIQVHVLEDCDLKNVKIPSILLRYRDKFPCTMDFRKN